MPNILAIDAGTTGVRALLIDADTASVKKTAYRDLTVTYPKSGWVEQDPKEIIDLVVNCLQEIDDSLNEPPIAIGITNQRETVICWNKITGDVLAPALVWQDRRTSDFCNKLKDQNLELEVRKKTGLYIDPYFSSTKINWLIENILASNDNVCFGTVDTWIVWNLTGGIENGTFATEVSNASRTQLFNIDTLAWDNELTEIFKVPSESLPEVFSSDHNFGKIHKSVGARLNFLKGVSICGVLGDQQAALFGQRCFDTGDTKATFGTGCFILTNSGSKFTMPLDGLLTTIAWSLKNSNSDYPNKDNICYGLEGSIFSCASTINWTIDSLNLFTDVNEINSFAEKKETNGGVFLVPAFTGLGSPWWDPDARAIFIGLSRNTDLGNIARAVFESIVFQTIDVLDIPKANGLDITILKVDGGVSNSKLLLKMLADSSQIKIFKNQSSESTAIGAALIAGIGIGYYKDLEDLVKISQSGDFIQPGDKIETFSSNFEMWHRAVQRSLAWVKDQ